jgi:hypothetical protein
MRRLLLAAAALAVSLVLAGAGTSAPRAAGDFWLGQWTLLIPGGGQGTLNFTRMDQNEAVAEWTSRAQAIGSKVKPQNADCLAYLRATYDLGGSGTWVGCAKHASQGVAIVTEDNIILGLTSDSTGTGSIVAGQDPDGSISVDHSRSCAAGTNSSSYACTTVFTGHRADRVATGTTKTVPEPAPGEYVAVSSPEDLPTDAATVDVTVSSSTGDLTGTEVFTVGENVAVLRGLFFIHCFELALSAVSVSSLTPGERLRFCISEVRDLFGRSRMRSAAGTTLPETAVASGCGVKRLTLRVQVRKKKIVSTRVVKRKLTAKSVRYSCTMSGGEMRITVDGRRKGGLRKALGKKLKLHVVRSKNAPRRNAKLSVTFGW